MTRNTKIFLTALGLAVVGACLKLPITEHVECLRTAPLRVKLLHGTGDGTISLAYSLIPFELILQYRRLGRKPTTEMFVQFASFILCCGATHVCNVLRFWYPLEYAFGILKHITGAVSLSVWWTLRKHRPDILALGELEGRLQAAVLAAQADAMAAQFAKATAEAVAHDLALANEEKARQVAALEARDQVIREFGAPILEVASGRVLVPLIGALDPARIEAIAHRLALYADARHPQWFIIELTGVEAVDTAVAHALYQMVKRLSLQGAQCVATGVRADVARTLVALGVQLGVPTYGTLADGIAATGNALSSMSFDGARRALAGKREQ